MIQCPTCGATPVDEEGSPTIRHAEGCELEAERTSAMEGDAAFFEAHPEAENYYRPPYRFEQLEHQMMFGPDGGVVRKVQVNQVKPGVRARLPLI